MNDMIMERRIDQLERAIRTIDKDDIFLNVKDVSELLKLSMSATYQLFNDPEFPGKKISGTYRVRKSQLYNFFDNIKK